MRTAFSVSATGLLLSCCVFVCVSGCDRSKDPANAPGPDGGKAKASLPADLILTEAPAEAKDVIPLKAGAKKGDEVILRGRIGGRRLPFMEGRALMTVVDMNLPVVCMKGGVADCEAPWDYCCAKPETITANMATVQVVGADGKLLHKTLEGVGGLKGLSVIVVKGTVDQVDSGKVLIVNATGIYVEPGKGG